MRSRVSRLFLLLLLAPWPARAGDGFAWRGAGDFLFAFGWEVATPAASLRSAFSDSVTTSGVHVEVRRDVASRASIGLAATWNRFIVDRRGPSEQKLYDFAPRGTFHLYLTASHLQPYLGVGIGAIRRELVVADGSDRTWTGVGVDPQIGLLWTMASGVALNLFARYQIGAGSMDVGGAGATTVKRPQWAAIQVGLAFY